MHGQFAYKQNRLNIDMTTESVSQQSTIGTSKPLLDKAFFGKDNCLTIQLRDGSCYFKWGKKIGDSWNWKNVKFSDVELGDILRVLEGQTTEAKFYHSFNDESTQIWINRNESSVVFKAADFVKGLNSGEQKVLEVLLSKVIWMMHVA